MGAMLLNHLSRPNVRQHGVEIKGEAVVHGEHTLYFIVEARDEVAADRRRRPLNSRVETVEKALKLRSPRTSALGCGFNRSMQQIVDIVRRVFRSLVFSLGDHLISWPLHLAWLASRPKCRFLWGSTASIARSYFH